MGSAGQTRDLKEIQQNRCAARTTHRLNANKTMLLCCCCFEFIFVVVVVVVGVMDMPIRAHTLTCTQESKVD